MRLVSKIYCLFILLGLNSCIQDYDVEFDAHNILSLNAEINPDEEIKVLLALPKNPNQHGDYVTPPDAVVTVSEDGNLFEVLTFQAKDGTHGVYVSSKKPQMGKNYVIEAQYKDLPAVKTVSQKIPEYPQIQDISFDKEFLELKNNDTLAVELVLQGRTDTPRYISVYSYLQVEWWKIDSITGNTVLEKSDYRLEAFDSGTGFRDVLRAWVMILPESNILNFNLQMLETEKWQAENVESMKLVMKVDELSEAGYLYRRSYFIRDRDNYGEPRLVYSNVENGLGVFSAIAGDIRRFKIK